MKDVVLKPGRVGSLATYLGYLFLRFPGTLGPEETWNLEGFDTYDRRWARQGRLWIQRQNRWTLVEPPALFPLDDDPSAFGLQAPQSLGTATVKVRPVAFPSAEGTVEGQLIKLRGHSFLALRGKDGPWDALVAALTTDGLEVLDPGSPEGTLLRDRGPGFTPPSLWGPVEAKDPGTGFLVDRLRDGWRVARQYEKGIRDDVDTECLHQYRVWLRRVRSLASLGRLWQLIPEWTRLKTVLRTLMQKTNELRDLDVLLLDFPQLQKALPWNEGDRLAPWSQTIVEKRHAEHRRVKAWLGSEEHRQLSGEVDRLLDDLLTLGEPWSARDLALAAFTRAARSLRKALKAVGPGSPDSSLHEVRIETKKLRYVLDSFGSLAPAGAAKTLGLVLKATQDGLGQFQDRCLLLERLRIEREALVKRDSPAFDPVTFGILVGVLAADQDRQRAQARQDCRQLQAKPFLRALDRLGTPDLETAHGS